MISEVLLVKSFVNFWQYLFPGGDDYVRLINANLKSEFAKPIEISDTPSRRALINNISFVLFELLIKEDITNGQLKELTTQAELIKKISRTEREKVINLSFGSSLSSIISENELKIIKQIAERLFLRYRKKRGVILRPDFQGCGIVFEAEGDLIYSKTLVEIKAGFRSFSILDIRQLYVYLALNYLSSQYVFSDIELCNPRTGIVWSENIDIISSNIGGVSTIDIFNEIIKLIVDNDLYS